jgi:hypothetical protein
MEEGRSLGIADNEPNRGAHYDGEEKAAETRIG